MKTLKAFMKIQELKYIKTLCINHPDFHITKMAKDAGVTRLQLYRVLERHNIEVPQYDPKHHERKLEKSSAIKRSSKTNRRVLGRGTSGEASRHPA